MNNHINQTIANVLQRFQGMELCRVWFDYLGLRLDAVILCCPGEEVDKGRSVIANKYGVPGDLLKFEKVEVADCESIQTDRNPQQTA